MKRPRLQKPLLKLNWKRLSCVNWSSVRRVCLDGWNLFVESTKKFNKDHLSAYAAQATFYLMMSLFPFVMLVCMASRLLPFRESTLISVVRLLVPPAYTDLGVELVDGYYNENIGSAKLVLIVFLVWTASKLIHALMNGFNSAYNIPENRNQAVLRLIGCLYTLALCVLLLALITMYAMGSKVMSFVMPLFPDALFLDLLFRVTRNLTSPVLLFLIFWISYVILPSRKTTFFAELPGALLTATVWRVAAALFTVFLKRSMERYSYVYGSLTGLVMILVWLYICVYFWFVGGELNWYLANRRKKDD